MLAFVVNRLNTNDRFSSPLSNRSGNGYLDNLVSDVRRKYSQLFFSFRLVDHSYNIFRFCSFSFLRVRSFLSRF